MPEIFEDGYFFPTYIWFFIVLVTIVHGPNGLNVIGLWCNLSAGESRAAATREATLLAYAKTFDKHALARGHLARWAKDLQDLADTIPDTHGLMIHTTFFTEKESENFKTFSALSQFKVWSGLHAPIRCQISPNHASWDTFSSALRDLKHGIETTPTSYSDDEDIDTTIVLETEILTLDDEKEQVNYRESHGARTNFSRYFWPRYTLPVLSDRAYSAVGAMQSAGMKLTGLVYDARKTIMNLGTVFVEVHLYLYQFEPLLHTSPQIYTHKQWNGVMQVPNGPSKHRGFKIGYAIEFLSHVLCWNSFDNNFRMHWRTPEEEAESYEASHVPDPIYNYSAWCLYTVEWLRQIFREGPEQLTLLETLSAPGRQPFRGVGRYGANEVLSIAGIPGWTLLSVIVADKVLFSVICKAFFQFVSVRALKAEEYYRMSRATSTEDMLDDQDVDHSINATLNQQLQYIKTLRTHGRNRTYVSEIEADLIDKYNEASLNTWDENEKAKDSSARQNVFSNARKTDMSKVFFPLDMANIRTSVTKFSHLGVLIAGEYWDTLMSELLQSQRTLTQLYHTKILDRTEPGAEETETLEM
ncbi:hypothetical protein B0H10DRAFT_1943784 [Mycena sp. CBHHK59/15]|nr:hypothetical protein B0H10DRAFT_1943784 [Mycena sp. CBHHK59/15]